ncbi:MAG: MarR family transcriptional regulator [Nitrososphaerota archaeon]
MVYLWRFRKFPDTTIPPEYMRILMYLRNNGPKSSREIAKTLGLKPRTIRRILQHLKRIGSVDVVLRPKRTLEDYNENSLEKT